MIARMRVDRNRIWPKTPAVFVVMATLCLAGLLLGGCVANPATGGSDFTPLMTPEKERALGAQEHAKTVRRFGVYQDPKLGSYVAVLGARLVAQSEMANAQFTFTVLDSATVNAFALPGGYIYITRGLLALANSEAQLVSVLGHEIGHVTARHSAQRYNRAASAGFLAKVVGSLLGSGAAQLTNFAGQSLVASYSRDQEHEADQLGIRYMSRASFDPRAAGRFLGSMRAMESSGKEVEQNIFADLFASHPNTAERVENAGKIAAGKITENPRLAHGRIGRRSYLAKLEGLPYGSSLKKGIIAKRVYLHKTRRVAASVPSGLKYQVTDTGFIAGNDQNLYLSLEYKSRASTNDPFRYLTTQWAKNLNLRDAGRTRVNGLSAAAAWAEVDRKGQKYQLFLAAIKTGRGQFHRLLMADPSFTGQRDFRTWLHGFRRISRREAARIKTPVLRIRRVRSGETVATLIKGMAGGKHAEALFRALNALPNDSQPRAGTRVKLVLPR